MSTTIDQRVVEMRFDNRQFEAGVSTTMSTLEKLKQKLKLTEASKGLEDLGTAAKKVDLTPIANSTDVVKVKFGALARYWDQTSRRIIDSANMTAKRIVSAFTIDPIKTGFSEYETQINAVQTILANTESKGKTLDDVNGALDELNKYADKTIYNFTEMTRNIGTFTAAGVDLDTSVSAIKGIANLAAVSGSTSQQASTAMYQLSQAMASGTVKLMDWNSVVNAGMGGQVFQDALKETAKVHGVAIDDIIAKQGSFRESLSEGWLTTEILTDTLAKFTGDLSEEQLKAQGYTEQQIKDIMKLGQTANDAATKVKTFSQLFDTLKEAAQSGWTQTWEILVGDFEEAKELLTSISDTIGAIIGKSADSRNELLENWKVLGGRQDLIESFKNIFEAIVSVVTPIKEAFREIFPPMTAERLKAITEGLKEFTAKLKLSDKGMENLKRTFKGIFAVVKVFTTILKAAFKAIGIVFDGIGSLGGGLLGVTAVIGDLLVAFAHIITSGNLFEKVFTAIGKVLKFVINVIALVVKGFASLIEFAAHGLVFPGIDFLIQSFRKLFGGMKDVGDTAGNMKEKFVGAFQAMGDAIKNSAIFKFFTTMWSGIKKVASSIVKVIGNIFGGLFDRLANADIMGIIEIINGLISGGVGIALINFLKGLKDGVSGIGDIVDNFNGILESVSGSFKAFQNSLNAEALKKIAIAIAILAGSLLVLSFINKDKLTDSLTAIVILFGGLMGTIAVLNKAGELSGASTKMIGLATSVLILSTALKKLSGLDMSDIGVGLVGLAGAMAIMVGGMSVLSMNEKVVTRGSIVMLTLSGTVAILASVLKSIAELDIAEVGIGLLGIFGIVTTLVAAMKVLGTISDYSEKSEFVNMKTNTKMVSISVALIALAGAIRILVPAVEQLGNLSWSELGKAGAVFGALLIALGVFALELKLIDSNTILSTAASIFVISTALLVLAGACKLFGMLDWEELAKGGAVLGALVVLMGALSVASSITTPGSVTAMAASIMIIAAALQMLVPVLLALYLVDWETIVKAGLVIGGLSAALVVLGAVSRFTKPGTINAMAASLLILSIALQSLLPSIIVLGLIPIDKLLQAGIAIGGLITALGLLGVVSRVVNPVNLLALAASLGVLAGSLLLLTVPLAIFSAMGPSAFLGIGVLAATLAVLGGAALLLKPLVPTLLALSAAIALLGVGTVLLGAGLTTLGAGLAATLSGLAVGLVALGAGIAGFVAGVISVVPLALKTIIQGIGTIIVETCKVIRDSSKAIGEALITLVLVCCDVLIQCAPAIVDAALVIILRLLESLAKHAPAIVVSLGELLIGVLEGLMSFVPKLVDILFDIVIAIIDGLAARVPDLIASVLKLFMSIFEGAIQALGSIDSEVLLQGLMAVGLMAGIVAALAAIVPMIPMALVGAVGMGVVATELAIVLAALGGLAQIPGLDWLISEGGNFLETIGTAIGQFVGGLAGGIAQGFTSSLPEIGTDLADFMTNLHPFIEGAKLVDASVVEGVRSLVNVILLITGAGLLEGITSWLTGESSIDTFASGLPKLGAGIKAFSDSLGDGINVDAISSATAALKALAEMAHAIPNEGGWLGKIVGENDIGVFGDKLPKLGAGIKAFSDSLGTGISSEAVSTATTALKSLAEMAAALPNSGGWLDKITGSNDISDFAEQLPQLGRALTAFSSSLVDMSSDNILKAVDAAKALVEMSNNIPNEGGIRSWFSGDSGLASFAANLGPLGTGIAAFATATNGITAESVTAAAEAGAKLAELTQVIPNEGGMKSWFSGESGMASFAANLKPLGDGIKAFATATSGITSDTVEGAADAAASLAEMTQYIPNEGGIKSWFSGDSGMVSFAANLGPLGDGIKAFAAATSGINGESVSGAAEAAKSLAEMTEHIPKEGGLAAWFSGESGVARFTDELPKVGTAIKEFATALGTDGVNPEALKAAAEAAVHLAQMTESIPKEGGIKAWFSGETSIANWGDKLPGLGEDMKAFSDEVVDIKPENVKAAAEAAKHLAQMTETVPKNTDKINTFGDNLKTFASKLAEYFKVTKDINANSITASDNAIAAIKKLSEIDTGKIKSVSKTLDEAVKSIKNLSKVPKDSASSFSKALKELGETSADKFLDQFDDLDKDMKKKGKEAIDGFIDGVEAKHSDAKSAGKKMASKAADGADDKKSEFKKAGKEAVQGFADGISANTFTAKAKAKAMAEAALESARSVLRINSPSKAFRELGYSIPEGLAVGIDRLSNLATKSAESMANDSINGVKNSISRIADVINGNMDAQPTIRPVLDLSDLKSGARSIGGLFNSDVAIGATANINAINSAMNRRNQNGTNNDVVSAINKLSKSMDGAKGDTYNFGNLSYNDDSNVESAVKELVRAITMGRRA